ncbi:helix-turn-helix protein [Aneurinibacillus soli]|uniref:Helix-turn-helix protein n=1 Tax=Aneurinibacillus soli TaxID=1500254 RepID=A0A0U5B2P8_9BACL|nr:helix-turn-helix domain-containing protein [Aneurinibacillus soli]PYE63469.1 helix-turn-helix protein [Aneurinibacillus soli]BAU27599.1 helix-turn-helix protein [Aneurinibacillus soli]
MFRDARKCAGLSREEAAFRIKVATKSLSNYEDGKTVPGPDVVIGMSREYGRPDITQRYCREYCPIGARYGYIHLDNISMNLSDIWMKLRQELKEALAAIEAGEDIVINKRGPEDFTPAEWDELMLHTDQFMDVEHNIEILKIRLGEMTDVSQLVSQHNQKMIDRGYARKGVSV